MAEIKIIGNVENTQQVSRFNIEDTNLLTPGNLNESFGIEGDYIELFLYDNNDNLLDVDYNYRNFKLPSNSFLYQNSTLPIIEIDPIKDIQDFGYNDGAFYSQYSFFRRKFSDNQDDIFISEISSDRTEIRINSVDIPSNIFLAQAQQLIDEFGVHPNNYVIYRTFTGDKSDNIPGVNGFGPKTILKMIPELTDSKEFTLENLFDKSKQLLTESGKYQTILDHQEIIEKNYQLMNLKLLDISGTHTTTIRDIINAPIPTLNANEFRRLFMEDKMWTTMKNLPEWLNSTWLSLNAFAQQTHK